MTSHNYIFFPATLLACLALAGCNANRTDAVRKDDVKTVMQPSVQKFDSVKEVKYPWGWIRWVMNSELDPAASQTFGIVQIEAGQRNPLHKHPNCEELLYVLSGALENVVGDKKVVTHAGELIRIPAGVAHQGINHTSEPMRAVISYSSGTRQMVALEAKTE
jgi:quercetin dioxygenase-like cupin family protein